REDLRHASAGLHALRLFHPSLIPFVADALVHAGQVGAARAGVGVPARSWHEMQPKAPLPMSVRPASILAAVSGVLCTSSSASAPSTAANSSGSRPTFGSPNCGMRRP